MKYLNYVRKALIFIVTIGGEIVASQTLHGAAETTVEAVVAVAGVITHYVTPNIPLPTPAVTSEPYAVDAVTTEPTTPAV